MGGFAAGVTLLLLFGLLSGGGVVAVEASDYTTLPLRGAAGRLAAAAFTNHSTNLSTSSTGGATAMAGPTCDAPLMASQLTHRCSVELDAPGALCCVTILLTVELETDCLCTVAEEPVFDLSDLSVAKVWQWYKSCGERRRSVPQDRTRCQPGSPPPPPPPPAKPKAPSTWPMWLRLAVGLLSAAAIVAIISVALKLWLQRTVQAPAPRMIQGEVELSQVLDVNGAAMEGVPQGTSGPGDVRARADEEAANAIAAGQKTSDSGEEEASPRQSPLRVDRSSQKARVRLPSPVPFEPRRPPVLPPAAVV